MDRRKQVSKDRGDARKPPVPSFGKKVAPSSRPTPGGRRQPGSPRCASGTPLKQQSLNTTKPDSKVKKVGVVAPVVKPKVQTGRLGKKAKYGSLKNSEMCPKCGTLVPKGVVKHGGEHGIGRFSISPKDLTIDTSKVLGQGGFGVVYLGDYQATEVAVKVMLGDKSPKKEEIEEWKKEVDIMTHLRHPNILSILGAVFDEGKLAIVTEYCAKGSLRKVVRDIARGARLEVTWGRKLDWLTQVSKGMAFLHHKKIHHRDLKGSNVFVSGDTMKIADFGLSNFRMPNTPQAKPPTPQTSPLSLSLKNSVAEVAQPRVHEDPGEHQEEIFKGSTSSSSADASGTFAFVSPEVWGGSPYTNSADVYAFGVLLIEIATSKVPFDDVPDEDEDRWAQRIKRGAARPVLPPSIGGEPVPETLEEVCKQCLNYDPKKRPTFREIVALLNKELEEPYSFMTCAVPYESDDDCEDPPIEEYDKNYDTEDCSDAEGWSRGEY